MSVPRRIQKEFERIDNHHALGAVFDSASEEGRVIEPAEAVAIVRDGRYPSCSSTGCFDDPNEVEDD